MLAGVSESPLLAGYKHSWTSLFVLEQHGAHRSAAPVSRFVKTLAPIFRIVIIMSLTLTLVVNYCDDLNPLDNLRSRLNGVRPNVRDGFFRDLWIFPRMHLRWGRGTRPWRTRTHASLQRSVRVCVGTVAREESCRCKGQDTLNRMQTGRLSRNYLKKVESSYYCCSPSIGMTWSKYESTVATWPRRALFSSSSA